MAVVVADASGKWEVGGKRETGECGGLLITCSYCD